jgi:hypothetical protein
VTSWRPVLKHEETVAAAWVATVPVACLPVCGIGQVSWLNWMLLPALAGVTLLLIWRIALIGVSISDTGIKVRHVTRTHIVPWPEVVQIWPGPAREHRATAIWISTAAEHIETPFWLRDPKARHKHRIKLRQADFDELLRVLNEELTHNQRVR